MTEDIEWDPKSLDGRYSDIQGIVDDNNHTQQHITNEKFNDVGYYINKYNNVISNLHNYSPSNISPIHIQQQNPNYKAMRRFFGWFPETVVRKTFDATTQYGKISTSSRLKKHY